MNVLISGGAGFIGSHLAAIAEASGLDAGDVGQTVDVFRFGRTDPVAVSVDVEPAPPAAPRADMFGDEP